MDEYRNRVWDRCNRHHLEFISLEGCPECLARERFERRAVQATYGPPVGEAHEREPNPEWTSEMELADRQIDHPLLFIHDAENIMAAFLAKRGYDGK